MTMTPPLQKPPASFRPVARIPNPAKPLAPKKSVWKRKVPWQMTVGAFFLALCLVLWVMQSQNDLFYFDFTDGQLTPDPEFAAYKNSLESGEVAPL